MFLKIDGIKGESLDRWHKEEIEIQQWNWTTTNEIHWERNQGGHSAGMKMTGVHIFKVCDRASTTLYQYCVTGKHFKHARSICRKNDAEKKLEYLTIEMEDVMVAAVKWSGNGEAQILVEEIDLSFAEFYLTYKTQKDTGDADPGRDFGFNIQTQVQK